MNLEEAGWFQDNGIYDKLRVAIETIRNGMGWEVFDGLQTGEVTVTIKHDGNSIVFVRQKPHPTEPKTVNREEEPVLPHVEEEKPRSTKRKKEEDI